MLVVFGSINVDLVFTVPNLPQPGETVLGPGYSIASGGKGANQAVAAARDGAQVRMFGCTGRDSFGQLARDSLVGSGVDISGTAVRDAPTGCAAVAVDRQGRNQIVVAAGANGEAKADQVEDRALGRNTTLLLQMEVPAAENAAAVARAKAHGSRAILNLAPPGPLPETTLRAVDVLVVNEHEAAWLARERRIEAPDSRGLAAALANVFGNTVLVTLGSAGAVAADPDGVWTVGALPITPVDTTGAGDAFAGVFAAGLDRGLGIERALHRASVAAGLACLKLGAQPSLPDRASIDAHLDQLAPPRRLS